MPVDTKNMLIVSIDTAAGRRHHVFSITMLVLAQAGDDYYTKFCPSYRDIPLVANSTVQ
jgi:hypothetical protein